MRTVASGLGEAHEAPGFVSSTLLLWWILRSLYGLRFFLCAPREGFCNLLI